MSEGFAIWPPYEVFYIHSLLFNTKSVMSSVLVVEDVMQHIEEKGPEALSDINGNEILDEIQNIVINGAAISRYFWPSDRNCKGRGRKLIESLEVKTDSAIKNRDLRNTIEHFDERLDKYLADGIVGNILPEYFGYEPVDDGVPRHLFRSFFINTGIFEILGKRFEIQPIVDEVQRIHNLLVLKDESGGRL